MSYHSSPVSLHKLNHTSRVLIPQVDVSTVTATDNKLTTGTIKVNSLHWIFQYQKEREKKRGDGFTKTESIVVITCMQNAIYAFYL